MDINITYRFCKSCGDEKLLRDFPINKPSTDGRRSECKVCFSSANAYRARAQAAEKEPHMFLDCNDCDHLFHKLYYGKERSICPKCKSKNLTPYEDCK